MGPEEEGRGLVGVRREGGIQRTGGEKVDDEKERETRVLAVSACSAAWPGSPSLLDLPGERFNPVHPRMEGLGQGPPTSDPKKVSLRSASCLREMASRSLGQERVISY